MMPMMVKMKMEPVRSHKTQRPLALGVLDILGLFLSPHGPPGSLQD